MGHSKLHDPRGHRFRSCTAHFSRVLVSRTRVRSVDSLNELAHLRFGGTRCAAFPCCRRGLLRRGSPAESEAVYLDSQAPRPGAGGERGSSGGNRQSPLGFRVARFFGEDGVRSVDLNSTEGRRPVEKATFGRGAGWTWGFGDKKETSWDRFR